MNELICDKCGGQLSCVAGCSAHPSNWYCPACESKTLSELNQKVMATPTVEELEKRIEELGAANQRMRDDIAGYRICSEPCRKLQSRIEAALKLKQHTITDACRVINEAFEQTNNPDDLFMKVVFVEELRETLQSDDAVSSNQPKRECVWEKTVMNPYGEYDCWSTSCGEDFAIVEEWHEKPTKFCSNCGGKTREALQPVNTTVDQAGG